MTETPSHSLSLDRLLGPALAFALGVLAAGYATLTTWTNAHGNATGALAGGSAAFGLFVVGTVVGFLAVFVALHRVVNVSQ